MTVYMEISEPLNDKRGLIKLKPLLIHAFWEISS